MHGYGPQLNGLVVKVAIEVLDTIFMPLAAFSQHGHKFVSQSGEHDQGVPAFAQANAPLTTCG